MIEQSQLRALIHDLGRAPARAIPQVTAVVTRGAVNVKGDWRSAWSGLAHAPALPAAISYDVTAGFGTVKAEIGPDKARRQGALGNLIEFGSVNNAPIPGGLPALQTEEPRFVAALTAALDPLGG